MEGNPAQALPWLARAVRARPGSPLARLCLAMTHAALGQRDLACEDIRQLHDRSPEQDPHYWAHKGFAFRRESDRQRILGWLHAAGVPIARRYPRWSKAQSSS